jgi:hypothetical protein
MISCGWFEMDIPAGTYVGLLAAIAFAAAWIVMFGPQRGRDVAEGNKETESFIPAAVLVGALAIGASLIPAWMAIHSGLLGFALVLVFFTAACAALGLLRPRRKAHLMMFVGLYALVAVPVLMVFSRIACEMRNSKVYPAVVDGGAELTLADVHALFIILCVVLSVILIYRGAKGMTLLSAIASAVFLVGISGAFFWTIPRAGMAILRWMFIVPAFLLAAIVLAIALLLITIRWLSRSMPEEDTAQESVEGK